MLAQAKKDANRSKLSKLQREQGANELAGSAQREAVPGQASHREHEQNLSSTSLASREPDEPAVAAHLQTASNMAASNSQPEEVSAASAEANDVDQLLLGQLLGAMSVSEDNRFGESSGDCQNEGAVSQEEEGRHDYSGSLVPDTKDQCACSGQSEIVLAERELAGEAMAGPSSDNQGHGEGVEVALFGHRGAAPALLRMLRCPLSQVSCQRGVLPAFYALRVV